jgi:putative ABC transport system substrate-binding protein
VADIQAAAKAANLRASPVLIGGSSELEEAFSLMAKDGAQAVIVQGFFGPFASRIVQIANQHRIGYMSTDRSAVAAGGLASVSANFPVLYEQAATYVDKILKGANPARLPVEQPSKFQITVNNKTVQALGLSISPTLLAQIDEVID